MGVSVVTTITTPATSYDLTDLDTVKDELSLQPSDVSNDQFLTRAITQVSKAVANYCNRVFPVEAVTDQFDIEQDPYPYQTPGGVFALQLARFPLVAVTSVTQTVALNTPQALVADKDYRVDAQKGWLIRLNPFTGVATKWESLPVTIAYTAGFSSIPDDLVDAVLRLITARFRARGRDPALVSRNQGGLGEERYWVGTVPGQDGPFPPEIQGLLDGTYRVPVAV